MTEVVKQVLPGRPAAALSGPNLAREIMAGQAAASVIATEDLAVATALQREIHRGMFRVYTHHDVVGCEIGGALKNVVAIATGMAQGLGVGDNTRAAVMSRGLAELTTLAVAMGGEPTTLAGLAGMGDLMATCMSPQSRNRHVGEQLGLGRPLDEVLGEMRMVAEGVKTVSTVVDLADRHGLSMPIARTIHDVVAGRIRAADAYRGLTRAVPARHESQPG
jgi:glycerol-3-phosphate dehydrogenase (NAD(P)+)